MKSVLKSAVEALGSTRVLVVNMNKKKIQEDYVQEEEDERDDSTPRVYLRERGNKSLLYDRTALRLRSLLNRKLSDLGCSTIIVKKPKTRPQRSQDQEEV